MFKNYNNWVRYPKLISLCLVFFSITRIVVLQFHSELNKSLFWIIAMICGVVTYVIFHYMNIKVELIKVSQCSSYKEAKDKYQQMLETITERITEKEMKQFISIELGYLTDEVKRFIFIKGIYSKIDEL